MIEGITKIWFDGGWLMIPLFLLTLFIYYTAIELLIRLNTHAIISQAKQHRNRVRKHSQPTNQPEPPDSPMATDCQTAVEVKRHFQEVRTRHIPVVNRRIRCLGIVTTAAPLMGLLGTVMGMLSTFAGLTQDQTTKFDSIVSGISQALITTQAGLIVAIPAMVLLSLIVQKRKELEHAIHYLEQQGLKRVYRSDLALAPASLSRNPPHDYAKARAASGFKANQEPGVGNRALLPRST